MKVFQKRNGEIAYSFCVLQKIANPLCKLWASPLDSEQELRSARPVENIFDSEVQCHSVFATETLIRQTGPFSAGLSSC